MHWSIVFDVSVAKSFAFCLKSLFAIRACAIVTKNNSFKLDGMILRLSYSLHHRIYIVVPPKFFTLFHEFCAKFVLAIMR